MTQVLSHEFEQFLSSIPTTWDILRNGWKGEIPDGSGWHIYFGRVTPGQHLLSLGIYESSDIEAWEGEVWWELDRLCPINPKNILSAKEIEQLEREGVTYIEEILTTTKKYDLCHYGIDMTGAELFVDDWDEGIPRVIRYWLENIDFIRDRHKNKPSLEERIEAVKRGRLQPLY